MAPQKDYQGTIDTTVRTKDPPPPTLTHIKQTRPPSPSFDLNYERTKSTLELLHRDESLRRLHLRNLLLETDLADLQSTLSDETDRAEQAELDADSWQTSAAEAQDSLEHTTTELRARTRELENLKAEFTSLSQLSDTSAALLTEKLSLQRELGSLKPELEHYRGQAQANEALFAEKLTLQREVASTRAELDDATRETARLTKKLDKESEAEGALKVEIEEVRRELALVKQERVKAEKVAQKAGKEDNTATTAEIEGLKQDLAAEKRERSKAEKAAQKSDLDHSASKEVLDDKLSQFRNKLRETKAELKETKEELSRAQEAAVTRKAAPAAKNPRKRAADADAAIGTPGDAGPGAKRNKRASSVIGEKSNFSITPLLNRTRNVSAAPEEQQKNAQRPEQQQQQQAVAEPIEPPKEQDPDMPIPSIEPSTRYNSPFESRETSAAPPQQAEKASKGKPQPLAPASPGKANLKVKSTAPARKKAAATSKLEMVTEEIEDDEGSAPQQPPKPATKTAPAAKPRLSLKPKSLSSFASFRDGSVQPRQPSEQPFQQKKKRKLLGNAAKTIFDEDEAEEEAPANRRSRMGNVGFGGQRAFGAFGGGGFGRLGGLTGGKKKGPLVVAEDGFMFSPLKKQRKSMAEASKASEVGA